MDAYPHPRDALSNRFIVGSRGVSTRKRMERGVGAGLLGDFVLAETARRGTGGSRKPASRYLAGEAVAVR